MHLKVNMCLSTLPNQKQPLILAAKLFFVVLDFKEEYLKGSSITIPWEQMNKWEYQCLLGLKIGVKN